MKELQNNFTTPEQSKRLLELGVPADSADCIFTRFSRDEKWKRRFIEDIISTQLFCNQDFYLPCWSVGQLMQIEKICSNKPIMIEYAPIGKLIKYLEIRINDYDFSKLEH